MLKKDITPEILVAYADNELNPKEMSEISSIIENDVSLKKELDGYRKSGSLLKKYFNEASQETPSYLIERIDEMFVEYDKKTSKKTVSINFLLNYLKKIFPAKLIAAFFVGLTLSPMIITTNTITLRGSNDQINVPIEAFIIQKNNTINENEKIFLDVKSTLRLRSKYVGIVDIFALVDGDKKEIFSNIEVKENQYIDMPKQFILTDEESFNIQIRFKNSAEKIEIIKNIEFEISQ